MKEWIITNGIGGYASSTDYGGMNTRKYHGLLIASETPPYNRKLVLSKLDESIENFLQLEKEITKKQKEKITKKL